MSAFPISPGGKPITNEEARAAVETALFAMGLTRPMTLAEKDAFCETANPSYSAGLEFELTGVAQSVELA